MADQITFDETTLLIHLGATRTGSKWVSNYFKEHSQILMSPIRVLNYFTRAEHFHQHFEAALVAAEAEFADKGGEAKPSAALVQLRDRVRMNHDPDAFLDYYRKRWTGEKVFADVTPSYYVEERDMFARMRDAHAKVRFLLVMRNPIDRLWSGMRLARMGNPDYDPPAKLDQLLGAPLPPWRRNYITALTDLDAVAPQGHLKVCFFEEMFDMAQIGDLCAFLEIETEPADVTTAQNQSEGVGLDEERRGRLYAKLAPVYRFVHDRHEGRLPASWLADMERFGKA
jgi:hypothetical protein